MNHSSVETRAQRKSRRSSHLCLSHQSEGQQRPRSVLLCKQANLFPQSIGPYLCSLQTSCVLHASCLARCLTSASESDFAVISLSIILSLRKQQEAPVHHQNFLLPFSLWISNKWSSIIQWKVDQLFRYGLCCLNYAPLVPKTSQESACPSTCKTL